MALSSTRANTILKKLDLPTIRAAHSHEQQYGRWVLDDGEFQQFRGWDTIERAVMSLMEDWWDTASAHLHQLTEKELDALRSIRGHVARSI